MTVHPDATMLLLQAGSIDSTTPEKLFAMVYDELRALAARYLAQERSDHTLQPTALVHEAYLRMIDQTRANWRDHVHFRAVAAEVMRRILVDHARARNRDKRRPDGRRLMLDEALHVSLEPNEDLIALDEVLLRLATHDARKARVVELRFFGGMDVKETAEVLGVSDRTVKNDWSFAKAWLHREMMRDRRP